jgi:hypothetical protein
MTLTWKLLQQIGNGRPTEVLTNLRADPGSLENAATSEYDLIRSQFALVHKESLFQAS